MSSPARFHDLEAVCNKGWDLMTRADGYLSEREARCIMIAAALAPAKGANLEIGSFKGRSTIGLAHVCKHYGLGKVVAVDPHTAPAVTDPDLKGAKSTLEIFRANLDRAKLSESVDIRVAYSGSVAAKWTDPIRFLWIDGDHTYAGARADVESFRPFLVPGALLLMHDVLGTHYGSLKVFVERVLGSDDFGPAGYSGSIGWAQYRPLDGNQQKFRIKRRLLSIPARQILPVAKSPQGLAGWNKLRYKIWRPLAPHGEMTPAKLWSAIRFP
ncbi:MAG TPA: class I SAM-dependent methyltransferase [Gemmatimonadaceae bacterium]|nr:class I SAM-dependent methyltransferase [Gemmatimonadaceae bacterium]